jgi:transcriptional regulator with GAF, ATPase, and Fis domain
MRGDETTLATRLIRGGEKSLTQVLRVFNLRIHAPGQAEREIRLESTPVRVGSAEGGNEVVVPDPAVSRYHFEITADEQGYRLRDLGSTNGTYLDSIRVNDGYLWPGVVINAGQTKLRFEPLAEEVSTPLSDQECFGPLVGKSPAMRTLFATLERVAPTSTTVLIEGETGTGKELVATALHQRGLRPGGPLIVFDCAGVPRGTLESALFGHEKGAFTGAFGRHVGVVEAADGGTLFIDELGELPLDLQPKLLRVLEQREVRRLGGTKATPVDIRVIAATNRDLSEEVNAGAFRADLYYRLAVIRLRLPPLRKRPEDIRPLVRHLVHQLLKGNPGRAEAVVNNVSGETWRRLEALHWRGNVRELRNVIERMLIMSGEIRQSTGYSLGGTPATTQTAPEVPAPSQAPASDVDLDVPLIEGRATVVHNYEKRYITAMLERHSGKIAPAARAAGIDRMYFKRLMKKRGI